LKVRTTAALPWPILCVGWSIDYCVLVRNGAVPIAFDLVFLFCLSPTTTLFFSCTCLAVSVDCNRCRLIGGLRWRDVFILFCGNGTICLGVYAAIFKDKEYCRMYGLAMMVFAFIVGLTGILTGLEVPVLQAAAQAVGPGLVDCEKIAYMMVDNARNHSMLYGANCILDCLGALYAIWTKEKIDMDDVVASHTKTQSQYDAGL
jgi:hypothetical protein